MIIKIYDRVKEKERERERADDLRVEFESLFLEDSFDALKLHLKNIS